MGIGEVDTLRVDPVDAAHRVPPGNTEPVYPAILPAVRDAARHFT